MARRLTRPPQKCSQPRTNNAILLPTLHCESRGWPHGQIHVYKYHTAGHSPRPFTTNRFTPSSTRERTSNSSSKLLLQRRQRHSLRTEPLHNMEGELFEVIQRLRKDLAVAMKELDTEEAKRRGFRERLQATRSELTAMDEKLAAVLAKQEKCGCECCVAGIYVHADLQVSHRPRVRCTPVALWEVRALTESTPVHVSRAPIRSVCPCTGDQ